MKGGYSFSSCIVIVRTDFFLPHYSAQNCYMNLRFFELILPDGRTEAEAGIQTPYLTVMLLNVLPYDITVRDAATLRSSAG